MFYPQAFALFAAIAATVCSVLYRRRVAWLSRAFRWLAALLWCVVMLSAPGSAAQAVASASPAEIAAFRERFVKALRRADLSMKEGSIALYGVEDHGRLRHELDEGKIRGVLMDRLPATFWQEWIELKSDECALAYATETTLTRALRVAILLPKPQPQPREVSCTGSVLQAS